MSEQLKHIFDISACPTKRQMKDYLSGTMSREEVYAFEHHINSCMLCSEALEGMLENTEASLVGMNELSNNFLKDHLELHPPQIHLNSIAHAAPANLPTTKTKKTASISWRSVGIAAAFLLCLGLGWYFKNYQQNNSVNSSIAQTAKQNGLPKNEILIAEQEYRQQSAPANNVATLPEADRKKTINNTDQPIVLREATAPAPTATKSVRQESEVVVREYYAPLIKKMNRELLQFGQVMIWLRCLRGIQVMLHLYQEVPINKRLGNRYPSAVQGAMEPPTWWMA